MSTYVLANLRCDVRGCRNSDQVELVGHTPRGSQLPHGWSHYSKQAPGFHVCPAHNWALMRFDSTELRDAYIKSLEIGK